MWVMQFSRLSEWNLSTESVKLPFLSACEDGGKSIEVNMDCNETDREGIYKLNDIFYRSPWKYMLWVLGDSNEHPQRMFLCDTI